MQNRRRAGGLGGARGIEDRVAAHQLFGIDPGVVVDALRTIRAVLGTAAGLDREQRRNLHLARIEVLAMNALGAEQQLGERQREQRAHLVARPVVANRGILACQVRGVVVHTGTMTALRCKSKRPLLIPPRPASPPPLAQPALRST